MGMLAPYVGVLSMDGHTRLFLRQDGNVPGARKYILHPYHNAIVRKPPTTTIGEDDG